ncbi:transforming growth factor beta regulator 1 [Lichtheimia corymbifera JMRC:FSU:9682]|uniref:Transforming growth factor beta regulator 1 n=1 Tax=Lichtheimia corymbifera JMRC:FSU:9682 TaxID=1263082 RepID=A0A068S1C4_9FUNG|nr:transforming growth factor beta regulator 1 [Lichtheimia corymbifera JMRC:FSU:9682]
MHRDQVLTLFSLSPDMLLYPDADCAVYSANFEEMTTAESKMVWEGHGLLSWILDKESDKAIQVTGKRSRSNAAANDEDAAVEVVLQLHPTHRISKMDYYNTLVHRRGLQISPTSPVPDDTCSSQVRRVISLPSMLPAESLSPPHESSRYPRMLPPIGRLSPEETSSTATAPPQPHSTAAAGPPSSSSPSSYDEHTFKKRKLSPPIMDPFRVSSSSSPAVVARTEMPPHSRTSPSLSLPPPSALLDLRKEDRYYYHQQQPPPHHAPTTQPLPPTTAEASASSSSLQQHHHHQHHHPYHHQQPPPPPHYPHPQQQQQHVRMPTQHTAVGRRKKRDTKPPNVNDVRTFVQVEKDDNGNYRLPVEIDSWTVLSLGDVIYDRPAFHNQRYIYPVGYKVKKWYRSMVDPRSDTQYTCEILDGGQEPIFRLEADDNPGEVYMGPTPTTVWTIAVRRAFAIRNMDYGHNPVGPDFFGLRKNTIAKMIQDLPNADKCKNYIWQTFKIGTTGRTARGKIFRPEDVTPDKQQPSSSSSS